MADKTKKNKKRFKVLFQSTNPNLFRASSIGYLYEINQKHRVVLLAQEIDAFTKKILADKNLFPGLEKIIFFNSPFYGNIFYKNYQLCRILKKAVQRFQPDIVIASTDIWPAEMYLMRFAKKAGAITVAIQDGFRIAEKKKLFLWSCLMNSYMKMPRFLPLSVRLFFVKLKKYLGHALYYWILPITAAELPFRGKTSFVLWDTSPGLRDADYSAVFSKRDYNLCIKDGVPPEKLFILSHPLENKKVKKFFEKAYFSKNRKMENAKILTIMWPFEKVSFKKKNYSSIPEEKMQENKLRIVKLIIEKLIGWEIFIKPHPAVKSISEIKELLREIPSNVSIVEPSEPADKYIGMSRVIVGIPPVSTTLFTASLQCPEKIILSLDLNQEFLGDSYKNFNGIEYIDNEKKLINVLNFIQDNKYYKKNSVSSYSDFSDTNELLDYIYTHHLKTKQNL